MNKKEDFLKHELKIYHKHDNKSNEIKEEKIKIQKHKIKKDSKYQPSDVYCKIIPISIVEGLYQTCDLKEIKNTVEKVTLIAGRVLE